MSVQITPSKRPYERSLLEVNVRRKWRKSTAVGSDHATSRGSSARNIIRFLFPASKIGIVIGKGGSNIAQIRQETGAMVHVEEIVPGCDERVVVIAGSDKDKDKNIEVVNEQLKADDGEDTKITDSGNNPDGEQTKISESDDNPDEHGEVDEDKLSVPVDHSRLEKENETSAIQKALLVVFDKMIDGLPMTDEESNKQASSVVRLLVFSSQVGCLLGKAGSVIKQMSSESEAQIRILPKDKLPSCASSFDELVQISGNIDALRRALQSVSKQLLHIFLRDDDSPSANVSGSSSHSSGISRQERFPSSNRPFHGHEPPFSHEFPNAGLSIPGRMNLPPNILSFRLLCNCEKVGGVIGKGGSVVKTVHHETGCEIKVLDGDSEDRIIVISGPAHPNDGISAPQEALLKVQSRIFRAAPENKEKVMIAKLLVASYQIGCLLGKGGSVISEMRKSTGAYIRILGKDQIPNCASENEEVVQVNGDFQVVQEALLQITTRLRNHFFREAFPPLSHPPNPAFMDQGPPPFPSYMGRREFSPPGLFSAKGPPFKNFDGPGGPAPHGSFDPLEDHPPFARDFPRPLGPPGPVEGPGSMGFPNYPGVPPRKLGGFPGRGHQPAIITSMSVEVVVPRFVVPAIYGEEGGCLRQILEISEAKIIISDSIPGETETMIRISGTPEQANAAQSLIQAFVTSETEGS